MEENEPKACRVCFDGETKDKKLINPCLCKGSSKYIHKECLYTWLNSQDNSEDARKCEVCNFHFKIKVTIKKRCALKEDAKSKGFKIFCIIFLILILPSLAIVIFILLSNRYISAQDNLVKFIGVLLGFAISFLCILTIITRIIQAVFCITTRKVYAIFSKKAKDDDSKKDLANSSLVHLNQTTEHHEIIDHREVSIESK